MNERATITASSSPGDDQPRPVAMIPDAGGAVPSAHAMPVAIDGTIRRISYRFVVLPRWTYDLGWVWLCSVQTLVIEHPVGCMDFLPTGGRL